ncbi:MAG: tetratricopeptide repeat protein [Polyangiaceae bacterium]|nr:tetratricopeptide repeat protein [Polyangiaceae bacterium]
MPLPKMGRRKLVGRVEELATLTRLIGEGTRVVTLIGPPGVGKTRLAYEAAVTSRRATGRAPLWAPLGDQARPDDVIALVGGLLGTSSKGAEPVLGVGRVLARAGSVLLILDDADAVQPGLGPILETWRRLAPDLSVVVTSRSRVGIDDEHVMVVPPLLPDDAIELFELRARAVRRPNQLAPMPGESTRKLAILLDCLPLAIEFAAARAAVFPVEKLLTRFESHLGDLLGAPAPGRGRHESLAASIEVSWQLLDERERRVLSQCATFAGSFALEAAEEVVVGEDHVQDILIALYERSLLERLEVPSIPGDVRFQLYRSVRAFALSRLSPDDAAAAHARLDAAIAREGQRLSAALRGPGAREAEARLELARTQLLVSFRHATDTAPLSAARAGLALSELSALRGVTSTSLAEATLRAARASADEALLVQSLVSFAVTGSRLGLVDDPRRALEEAVSRSPTADVLFARGRFHAQHGSFDEADADLARAATLVEGAGEPHLFACVRNVQGCVAEIRGDLAEAARAFEAARSELRRCGGERMEAAVLNNLGVVRQAEGRLEDSLRLYESALDLAVASDNRIIEADARMNLGSWHLGQGGLDRAEEHSRAALALQRRVGNRRFEGVALANLALVCHERGELRDARGMYQDALTTLRECGEARFEIMTLPYSAACEAALGLLVEARADFAAAARPPPGMDPSHTMVVTTLESFLLLAEARAAGGEGAREASQIARERLDNAKRTIAAASASRRPELSIAARMLERALGAGGRQVETAKAPDVGAVLLLGERQRWFSLHGGRRVDLSGRGTLRLILRELVAQRRVAPGAGVSAEALFGAGWHGERALSHAAANRVYAAIATLRRLGLGPVLLRQADGYLLDPGLQLLESSESP